MAAHIAPLTQRKAWKALQAHYKTVRGLHLRKLFAEDPKRGERMTLTYPILNRSRGVLWLVTGIEKVSMFVRLRDGDASIPAGRVRQDHARLLADRAAAGEINNKEGSAPEKESK